MTAALVTERCIARFQQNLDRAVAEVFSTMIGIGCAPTPNGQAPERAREMISAVVGLAGAVSGSLVLHGESEAAMLIAGRMTGMLPQEVDSMVRDAMGEVCNMVAGAWKGLDAGLASDCLLSTPTVITGAHYELFGQRAPIRIARSYRFQNFLLTVMIFCQFAA